MSWVTVAEANAARARRRARNARQTVEAVKPKPTEVRLPGRTTVRAELLRFFSGEDPLFGTPRSLVDWPSAFATADRMDKR